MDERIYRAIQGDSHTLGQLLFECHDNFAKMLRSKIPNDLQSVIDAEDVLQQAYMDAFRDIRHFEPKSDRAFYRWLEAIAQHRLLDTIRAHRSKKRGGDRRQVGSDSPDLGGPMVDLFDVIATELPTPSRNVAREEGVQALLQQVAGLVPEHQEVVRLYHLEGLDLDAVARRTGRTPSGVRGILYRAHQKLRDGMGESSLWLTKK